jgi:hypothetical protein
LVGRGAVEPIGENVVAERMRRADGMAHRQGGRLGRRGLGRRQRAHCDDRTVRTHLARLFVGAARHIGRHRRHIGHSGGHHVDHGGVDRRRRRDGRNGQSDSDGDRQQPGYEQTENHAVFWHGDRGVWKGHRFTSAADATLINRTEGGSLHRSGDDCSDRKGQSGSQGDAWRQIYSIQIYSIQIYSIQICMPNIAATWLDPEAFT